LLNQSSTRLVQIKYQKSNIKITMQNPKSSSFPAAILNLYFLFEF